ncbi:unnamed protein product, partial [Amoebophrya sp. A120]
SPNTAKYGYTFPQTIYEDETLSAEDELRLKKHWFRRLDEMAAEHIRQNKSRITRSRRCTGEADDATTSAK